MREILFRAKAINRIPGREYRTKYKNGDWLYGLITKLYNEEYDLPAEMTDTRGISGIEVDYKTIGQYTGLMDKNGVKIFDGDIVMTGVRYDKPYSKSRKEKRLIGKVEHHIGEGEGFFNDDTGKYDAHKMYSSEWKVTIPNIELEIKYCCYTWGDFFDCEVIGNIYDNPELLGGDDNA